MPKCSCFHEYELTLTGSSAYKLEMPIEGEATSFKDILENSGLCRVVSAENNLWKFTTIFTLSRVSNETDLRHFLDLLRSHIIVDLTPALGECYALFPYTAFDQSGNPARTRVGDLLNQAKYRGDEAAWSVLREDLEIFIGSHPGLRSCEYVTGAPKSDPSTPDLAARWANAIATKLGWHPIQPVKIHKTAPQKEMAEEESEEGVAARVARSMKVEHVRPGTNVLVLDDTIRSGGTMKEMARALREAGAGNAFGLGVAKDAKFTLGGMYLSKEKWQ